MPVPWCRCRLRSPRGRRTGAEIVNRTLRVAVVSADPEQRAALAALVEGLGHTSADTSVAEVVLTDGSAALPDSLPAVLLGGGISDAAGVLDADAPAAHIDAALRAVAAGLRVRQHEFPSLSFGALEDSGGTALLTPREIEVLVALSEGLSNKAVARRLDISQHTVKFHVESVFRKLGVTTRAEAVARGLRQGLVHL